MPKIQWDNLPEALTTHLFLRARERQLSFEDIYKLKEWRETAPDAPEGEWWKDFRSFKLCGEGKYPKTFLLKGQPAKGTEIEPGKTGDRRDVPQYRRPRVCPPNIIANKERIFLLTSFPSRSTDGYRSRQCIT